MIIYSINQNLHTYILTAFGDGLEWNETIKMPVMAMILFVCSLGILTLDNSIKNKLKKDQIVLIVLVVIVISGLIFCSLYVQWTYTESIEIQGIQGRYIIPVLPLLFLLLGNIKLKSEITDIRLTKIIVLLLLIVILYTVLSIVIYHI